MITYRRRTLGALIAAAGAMGAVARAVASPELARPAAGSTWRRGPDLGVARAEVAAAQVDGTIYVLGGLDQDGHTLNTVEALPPDADVWQVRAPLPEPRDHLGAVALGGQLYAVAGSPGWFGQQTSQTLWVYDALGDRWEGRAPLPLGRAAHAVGAVDGRLYVAGGIGVQAERVLIYDAAGDRWHDGAPLRRPREHLAAAGIDGKLYLVGGRWAGDGNLDTFEVYDPLADAWQALPAMPTARGGLAAAALDGRLYVTGGEVLDDTRHTFAELEVYDPATGAWTSETPLPTARHGLGAVTRDGELYVLAGGRLAGLEVSNLVEILTPDG
jgi:N-acetylneuraminic acid mutarotase